MANIPCPKCKSRSTHIARSRSPYIGNEPDMIFHCVTCGTRIYGPEKVKALVAAHEAIVQGELEREARLLEEERLYRLEQEQEDQRKRLEAIAKEAERLELGRKREHDRIMAAAKCAWPPCEKDHTMTSRYCSRVCSNKNAHAREKAKKEAAKGQLNAG